MPKLLDIHRASPAERTVAFQNFHEMWGRGLSLDEHVRSRLSNSKYDNAQWYVGCLDGQVVTACGCYQFEFFLNGKIEPAFALGEVHTLPDQRGNGFAPQLLAFVEIDQRSQGKTLGALYSDIDPAYYERMGYILCDCPQGFAEVDAAARSSTAGNWKLVPFRPTEAVEQMAAMYEVFHRGFPLSVARSSRYWSYLISRNPGDVFYFWEGSSGPLGYVRVATTANEIKIRDFALTERRDDLCRELFSTLLEFAKSRKIKRVGGWLPRLAASSSFQISERTRELTMIKPLVPHLTIGTSHRSAGEYLHEIDHV